MNAMSTLQTRQVLCYNPTLPRVRSIFQSLIDHFQSLPPFHRYFTCGAPRLSGICLDWIFSWKGKSTVKALKMISRLRPILRTTSLLRTKPIKPIHSNPAFSTIRFASTSQYFPKLSYFTITMRNTWLMERRYSCSSLYYRSRVGELWYRFRYRNRRHHGLCTKSFRRCRVCGIAR